jgi:hypothetical protein
VAAKGTDSVDAFRHPPQPLTRRHGPTGYADYQSYRPWLRDEFTFRCVYCLIREQWGRVTGEFDLDHFLPQASHPDKGADYLLYACRPCNLRKRDDVLLGYPDDLPDLRASHAPHNTRPEGIEESYFARRERRELPEQYVE